MKNYDPVLAQLFKVLERYKPLSEDFLNYVADVVERAYFPADKILYDEGQVIKDVYFLASGTMATYTFTEAGEKQFLHIYQANEIVAGASFTLQKRSRYYVMVCADAYLLSINYKELKKVYQQFPEVEELARMIISAREGKELKRNQMLIEPGIQMVEDFYKTYPELLEPGKVLRDVDIASYLLLAEGTLRSLRNKLLQAGALKLIT